MLNERETRLLTFLGIAVLASASRTILTEERRTFLGFLRALILAAFVGSMVNLAIQPYALAPETQGVIVGLAAFIADDLLLMLLRVSNAFRDNPRVLLDVVIRLLLRLRSDRE